MCIVTFLNILGLNLQKGQKKILKGGGGGGLIIVLHNSFEDIVEHKWILEKAF